MQTFAFTSWDGTALAGFEGGNPRGRTMVLVNGLGGNIVSWRPFVKAFRSRFHLLSYDYRGLYRSGKARSWDAYTIAHHARDLEHLLDTRGIREPILVGWSMGVQVILELHRRRPELAGAFVALNGTPGQPFTTAFDSGYLQPRYERIFRIFRSYWRTAVRLRPVVAQRRIIDLLIRTLQAAGIAGHTLDRRIFHQLALEWIEMDLGVYAWIFEQLGHHDATDLLARVRAPTLIVAGQHDRFTPAHRSVLMANAIPDAELHVVAGATHFCPVEYPDQINRRVWRFLADRALLQPVADRAVA